MTVRSDSSISDGLSSESSETIATIRRLAGQALIAAEFDDKAVPIERLVSLCESVDLCNSESPRRNAESARVESEPLEIVPVESVGRPSAVELVAPRELRRRTWGSPAGRVVTLHALAHIEANAVNLALDAAHRFGEMPLGYYLDWVRVAAEEFGHFRMIEARLAAHDAHYGSHTAHNGLWDIAVKTAGAPLDRMALVPMVFEARGLDVTPGLIERFERHGDGESAAVLRVVLRDEVGHVRVGVDWFQFLCAEADLDPSTEFDRLVAEASLMIVPPFNEPARIEAGFAADDLERWKQAFVARRG